MLCERCKKRPAMIYIQTSEDGQIKSKGYCLTCARELGIKPVDDMMKKMGIDDNALKAMEEQMNNFVSENTDENGDFDFRNFFGAPGEDYDDGFDEDFEQGGSSTIPFPRKTIRTEKRKKTKRTKENF